VRYSPLDISAAPRRPSDNGLITDRVTRVGPARIRGPVSTGRQITGRTHGAGPSAASRDQRMKSDRRPTTRTPRNAGRQRRVPSDTLYRAHLAPSTILGGPGTRTRARARLPAYRSNHARGRDSLRTTPLTPRGRLSRFENGPIIRETAVMATLESGRAAGHANGAACGRLARQAAKRSSCHTITDGRVIRADIRDARLEAV